MTFSYSYNGSKKYLGREKKNRTRNCCNFLTFKTF